MTSAGEVLGKTNEIVTKNPINQTLVSFGTDKTAVKKVFNIEQDDDGVYRVHDENSTGAQGFLNATFKTLLSVFGYDKEQAIKEVEEAERIQTEEAERIQEEEPPDHVVINIEEADDNNGSKSYFDMDYSAASRPKTNAASGGGINNFYGRKNVTIYKILGLLLLSLYLEHYKK